MAEHRQWDENRSPQWKYLFQKEALNRRKSRRDLDKELRENIKEQEENYNKTIKFGANDRPSVNRIRKKSKNIRKVSKEQLRAKREATNNEIKKLLKDR